MPPRPKRGYDPQQAGCLCSECPLRGAKVVPPLGNPDAKLMIIGDAPGFQEEKLGEPFVGPAGMGLAEILFAVGLKRSQVWLSNVLLCRTEIPGAVGADRYDMKSYLAAIRKINTDRKREAKRAKTEPVLIASPIDCCSQRLWSELAHFEKRARELGQPNGAVVIPVGNFAAQAVTSKNVGIMKLRGSPCVVEAFEGI